MIVNHFDKICRSDVKTDSQMYVIICINFNACEENYVWLKK